MAENPSYAKLSFFEIMPLVRSGDPEASAELVRRYEPAIRLAVRARLTDPRLRRLLDSMDICQSVLASFFVRVGAGQYDLDQPSQLIRLLKTMARNKLVKQAERHQADRRDCRRQQASSPREHEIAAPEPSPSDVVANRELLVQFRQRLSPRERQVVDLRQAGRTWQEVATAVGSHPDVERVRHSRLITRILQEMGLEETDPGDSAPPKRARGKADPD
jgi:RNA polymerase sigma-70 factor (ECF subfamily)